MYASSQHINIISIGSVHTVEKTTEALVVSLMDIGLEVNAGKTKYRAMSHDQNAGRYHYIKTDNCSLEMVE
jgi:hypothetical protein